MSRMIAWEDLGDGRVRVLGESDRHNKLSIVVGRNLLNTPTLDAMIDLAGIKQDAIADALDARRGRTEWEE